MFFKNIINEYAGYKELLEACRNGKTPVSVSGISESAQSVIIYTLTDDLGENGLVITYNDIEAKKMAEDLEFFTPDAVYFSSKEYTFYDIDTKGHQKEFERIAALYRLITEKNIIAVTSLEALCDYTISKDIFEKYRRKITVGDTVDLSALEKDIVTMGYKKQDIVESVGQFSLRGGIFDIFCPHTENPVRIEFFDNEVDSIREFDFFTQRSMGTLDEAEIIVCSEAVFDDEKCAEITAELKKILKRKSISESAREILKRDIINFEENHNFASIDKYAHMIYGRIPTICDYFSESSVCFVTEPKRIAEINNTLNWERGEMILSLTEQGIVTSAKLPFWADYNDIIDTVSQRRTVSLKSLSHTNDGFVYKALINFITKTTVSIHGKLDYLFDDLESWKQKKFTVAILASSRAKGENLAEILYDRGITARYINDRGQFEKGEFVILKGNLSKGFEYPEINLVLISEKDIYTAEKKIRKSSDDNVKKLKSFNDINIGDYVVHKHHGIGRYMGIHQIDLNNVVKDYLKIQYKGTDILYVPVDQLDMLFKYIGSDSEKVKVNKLGGKEWQNTKNKVRRATHNLAINLIKLYAEREYKQGYAFSADSYYQREFEDRFIYQETEDQLRSIQEVKNDMELPKPMDRLLCGDVGYGKTEIAIRAAFKAALDSKQVAYLCPTTILAMQHYETFCKRMEDFAVNVEMLSRFRTPAQQRDILKRVRTGEVDILIGTHKILQDDVKFADLGLLIIDEEQRFGVAHKEKLKDLKKNIDVLTMTATPIPRTLHMAMIDIRDMSILAQPPENRYPVQTYVLEHNMGILADAMRKELARGGQVFYLYNRIDKINEAAAEIKALIPEARVAVGHGRMSENMLENIMYDMINGNTDILVCTTIIETGLDIPNANTMIIENADRMGLSQLYQLRGRIGRSNRSSYAYLTYKKDKTLSDVAQKRLSAIKEFTEFGSGFKIAMRDLEIRGAGDILGAQQHGHMDAVGYDMYCKLLKESINEVKGEKETEEIDVKIEIDISAYIPGSYIKNHNQRIDIYKRIAAVSDDEDALEVTDELIDRYGDIPKSALNLIEVALIKSMAKKCGVYKIIQNESNIFLHFIPSAVTMPMVAEVVAALPSQILFSASEHPYLTYRIAGKINKILPNLKLILQIINSQKSAESVNTGELK